MQAIGAILLILIIYLLYQLVVFLFNSGLLLITVVVLLVIFILLVFIGADNAVKKEKKEKEKLNSLENEQNSKYEIWKEENIDILSTQESYEKKGFRKIEIKNQFNEIAQKFEMIKHKLENSRLKHDEKTSLLLEKNFYGKKIAKLGGLGKYRIFYIFIEDSVLKIRERIIFGSKFLNESLDIRIEDIYYYQESGKIATRERKAGYVRQSKSPGVIESAIVGGLIAGSTGAIVGGMSGLNNANKRSTEYTITEHNDNREIVIFYKDVERKNKIYEFKGLKNYNATWKILSELIPDKSYDEVALQNGNFHLLGK